MKSDSMNPPDHYKYRVCTVSNCYLPVHRGLGSKNLWDTSGRLIGDLHQGLWKMCQWGTGCNREGLQHLHDRSIGQQGKHCTLKDFVLLLASSRCPLGIARTLLERLHQAHH